MGGEKWNCGFRILFTVNHKHIQSTDMLISNCTSTVSISRNCKYDSL